MTTTDLTAQALAAATESGRISRDQGGQIDALKSLWDMEMAHGDWADVLDVIDEDEAKEAYAVGLRG